MIINTIRAQQLLTIRDTYMETNLRRARDFDLFLSSQITNELYDITLLTPLAFRLSK